MIQLTWEPEAAAAISKKFHDQFGESPPVRPFLVALVAPPGAGKTTSAPIVSSFLDGTHPDLRESGSSSSAASAYLQNIVLPMDGYHYPLATLRSMAHPHELIYRRGAPETFDTQALRHDLAQIQNPDVPRVLVPGFDHARGDPEPDVYCVDKSRHVVVIFEGLYFCHNEGSWTGIPDCFDFMIYIDVDMEVCLRRVKSRNQDIPGYTRDEMLRRCDDVDRRNAQLVLHCSPDRADLVIKSL